VAIGTPTIPLFTSLKISAKTFGSMSSDFFEKIKDIKLKSAVDGSEVLATDLWKDQKAVVRLFRRLG